MTAGNHGQATGTDRSRLFVFNSGFVTQRRVRRILQLAGYDIRLGLPGPTDLVGIWGNSPTAHRGRKVATDRGVGLLHIEDSFLRSIHPGRSGEPPTGLLLDRSEVHFDASQPSDLETLLTSGALDDTALLNRARDAMARLREHQLSKYNAFDPDLPAPDPGYVLVIDQIRGDASVTASRGNDALFREMLVFAQEEHPGARVIIKTHPETSQGFRPGYFSELDVTGRVSLLNDPVSPWALLEGAVGVYTVSSQLGFEAILAGHKPRVFGQPFYAGWGLSLDENPVPRRTRNLTRAQLFAASMILYPIWYDPFHDRLCPLETVLDNLEAQTRAWRQDRTGWVASDISLWKRPTLQRMFGREKRVVFSPDAANAPHRRHMVWASKASPETTAVRVEDGFLRSRGLGAQLVPPLSLVLDDLGIYYDPTRPSRLEQLIEQRAVLRPDQLRRAEHLVAALVSAGLSKYNTGGVIPDLPTGHRILVSGQVEDDASILTGAPRQQTNRDLLAAVRAANPNAVLVYKPHPDVEAGLRPGAIDASAADVIVPGCDPAALLSKVDEVWTMTSLLGFEALVRHIPVTVLGVPFYAGWGLTKDLADIPERRQARPGLMGLVHAALIDYPRYYDPVTGQACPVEVAVQQLENQTIPYPGVVNRSLSKLQGLFATYAHFWR